VGAVTYQRIQKKAHWVQLNGLYPTVTGVRLKHWDSTHPTGKPPPLSHSISEVTEHAQYSQEMSSQRHGTHQTLLPNDGLQVGVCQAGSPATELSEGIGHV
jgi:hypothetical protein